MNLEPSVLHITALLLISVGALFFLAGTVGLLRFKDFRNRVHALTKADSLGLGLVLLGVALLWAEVTVAVVVALVWFCALICASASARALGSEEAALVRSPEDQS